MANMPGALLVAASIIPSAAYDYIASTTRYGDTAATACGGLNTMQLRSGTEYYVVASSQSMQDAFPQDHNCNWQCSGTSCQQTGDCWCGSSSGAQNGTATAAMGCFTCARGRFVRANPYNGLAEDWEDFLSEEIKIVVADICPFGTNSQWCPAAPGQLNHVGKANHLDFTAPPAGIDNHYFVFAPEPCDDEINRRMIAAASCQGGLPLPPQPQPQPLPPTPLPTPQPTPQPTPVPAPSPVVSAISSSLSGQCLGLRGPAVDGAGLQVGSCVPAYPRLDQQWLLVDGQLLHGSSDGHTFCMDIPENDRRDGQRLQIWSCNGFPQQQFQHDSISGFVHTTDRLKCLDLKDGASWEGAPVQLWGCSDGNVNQQWQITRVQNPDAVMFV